MTPHKIIGEYCSLHGIDMPEIDYSVPRFFVTISTAGARVLYLREPAELLGRVVGNAMKQGIVLYVNNGYVKSLDWDSWKKTWARLFSPKKQDNTPKPNRSKGYHSEIFSTMQPYRNPKKPQKHGFERTYTANKSIELLGAAV